MNNAYCDCKVKNICRKKNHMLKTSFRLLHMFKKISQVIKKFELFSRKIDYNLDVKKFKAQKR